LDISVRQASVLSKRSAGGDVIILQGVALGQAAAWLWWRRCCVRDKRSSGDMLERRRHVYGLETDNILCIGRHQQALRATIWRDETW